MIKPKPLTLERKKALFGFLFVAPWLIGFLLLMAVPFYRSLRFSLSKLTIDSDGYSLEWVGLRNYRYIFMQDAWFVRVLTDAVVTMATNLPLIIFSVCSRQRCCRRNSGDECWPARSSSCRSCWRRALSRSWTAEIIWPKLSVRSARTWKATTRACAASS
ncbi:hypothetical protein [Paenibacillus cisolokensis]|uniref:hypothetical protein n=1 Tax=Paenibacillus cisolokensis TaxID=1658519 RepID=UPI0027DB2A50|nr:hypothetical protein [Paenibacillus cisolokensis]